MSITIAPVLRALALGAVILAAGHASAAQAPLAALRTLEPGEWELRPRGEEGAARRLCVGDFQQLLQLRHVRNLCKRYVVSDTATAVAVSYDCASAGSGRTDVRVETSRLAQVRSQGIADGAPFSFALEARRIGACAGKGAENDAGAPPAR